MRFSVVIATCGSDDWSDLAHTRAFPSAQSQGGGVEVVIQHYRDLSLAAARNAAAKLASGDWLVFLDADDELEPGYLAAMGDAFLRGAVTTDWAPLLVPAVRYVSVTKDDGETWVEAHAPAIPNRGRWPEVNECVVGTAIRRACFDGVGGFREWPLYEDWDLFLRAYDAGARLVYVEDAVYRAHMNLEGGRNYSPDARATYDAIWADHLARTSETLRYCCWSGCADRALVEPAGRGRLGTDEFDLFLCQRHRDLLARGTAAHVSIALEPTPARPRSHP